MTAITERPVRLENELGLPVRCDVRVPEGEGPFPTVVILHGFKGFKDWGMFPPTARRLYLLGLTCLTAADYGSASSHASTGQVRGPRTGAAMKRETRTLTVRLSLVVVIVVSLAALADTSFAEVPSAAPKTRENDRDG